jgi:hypothetical protein
MIVPLPRAMGRDRDDPLAIVG